MHFPLLDVVLDALFPKSCYGCKMPDTYLCAECARKCFIKEPQCPHCGIRIPFGVIPVACKKHVVLDSLFLAMDYNNEVVRRMVTSFKYKHCFTFAEPLTKYALVWMNTHSLLSDIDKKNTVLIPVPSPKQRIRKRGFHPALKIANVFSDELHIPIVNNALSVAHNTKQQAKITHQEERRTNVRDAFTLSSEARTILAGKTILLIDDVYTTGATMASCARILKRARVKEIRGVALAKD